jgi:ABC-type transport system substrate-binding protein
MRLKQITASLLLAATFATIVSAPAAYAGPDTNIAVIGVGEEPTTLDPANGLSGGDIHFLYTVYDRLLDFDPATLEPRPMLAESLEWADENRTLVLKLRQGVTFHDGEPFNAEAVKTSIEFYQSSGKQADLNPVTEVEVVDEFTIALHVDRPYSVLTSLLMDRGGMIISPKAIAEFGVEGVGRNPAGTGPFRVVSWAAGDNLALERFPDYWNPERIKLDGLEYRIIKNQTTVVSALMAGQVDYVMSIDPVNLPVIRRNPNLQVMTQPTIASVVIAVNTNLEPVSSKLVRQAFSYGIDREALARIAYGGEVEALPASLLVPPSYWPSTPELDGHYTYDPVKAKQLVTEAGYPDGVEVAICANANSGSPAPGAKLVDMMREQLRPAGITLNGEMLATGAACIELYNGQQAIMLNLAGWSGRPSPIMTYQQTFTSYAAYHVSKEPFDGVDAAVERLLATSDPAEQEKIFDELNAMWVDNVPWVSLYFQPRVFAQSSQLAGELPNLMGKANLTTLYFE